MNSHRILVGWLLFFGIGAWPSSPVAAEEIGNVYEVRSEVLALAEGKSPRQLKKHDPLENGLRVRLTRRESYLQVFLYDIGLLRPNTEIQDLPIKKPPKIDGVIHLAGQGRLEMGNPNPSLVSGIITTVIVEWGDFWASLRPGRSHDIQGKTREGSLEFKGTAVRVLADPVVGTFVAVDEGVAIVHAFAGGDVEVTSGHWVLIPPGGVPTRPATLDSVDILEDPPLLLRDFTTGQPERPPQ
ncbi:MAG TPA: hypothetical protein VGM86_12530 [Thermoanaerobaculia bacterium]